jgi:hypothetical protein
MQPDFRFFKIFGPLLDVRLPPRMNLALLENSVLRAAVRRNLVSFPAQIPAFTKRGYTEERIVHLYFICGWKVKAICTRYRLSRSTARKMLSEWKIRAVAAGYVQEIHPDAVTLLAAEPETARHDESDPISALQRVA